MTTDPKPDLEFALSVNEMAQAICNYLRDTRRLPGDFNYERTNLILGLGGQPATFQIWERKAGPR